MVERGGGEKSLVSVVGRVIITKKQKKKQKHGTGAHFLKWKIGVTVEKR